MAQPTTRTCILSTGLRASSATNVRVAPKSCLVTWPGNTRSKDSSWECVEKPCTNLYTCKRGLKVPREDVIGLSNMAGLQSDQSGARKFTTILKMFSSVREADKKTC
ncbi:hypothetical protein FOQG_19607 [Fusarium oxysporum f. sp. raphani 54005]|uniref:Uncharacterized protein n=1 Tax=Fusarium oxysporum f. sp. raphani 54005 TaxID=1089458 RepID=X0B1K2_FUSOX|nr:hypothetical protein FOQG_19607 [Fusarium oxysporum f. sp. raphani 54005]EXL39107.1 hypothetical protein FOCG_18277 [Fusarium oxysporum f. sp. radicis-lycopersici 26381]EXL39118.1 hypothetical protein FOCG_18260 [Fusarium oxysporum f. sp. radicis-lycopersici 26381]